MLPLFSSVVRANDSLGCLPTLDPCNQTQQDVVIRLINRARERTKYGTL